MADDDDRCPSCLATFALVAKTRIGVVEMTIYDCPLCRQYSKRVLLSPSISQPMSTILKNKHYGGYTENE